MTRLTVLILALATCHFSLAQKPKIQWGEELLVKITGGESGLLQTDNSGLYLEAGNLNLKTFLVFAGSSRQTVFLVKLDRNLAEVYRNDFEKELKGKRLIRLFSFQQRIFVFASAYDSKMKSAQLLAAEINKNTGAMMGEWTALSTYNEESRKGYMNIRIDTDADSSRIIVAAILGDGSRNEYRVDQFDKNLKPVGKPTNIRLGFEEKTYRLEDVLVTSQHQIVLVGRRFEYREGKKKKEKFLDFASYSIRIYNELGGLISDINTTAAGKWLSSARVLQEKNRDLVLAAFYSKAKGAKQIDGIIVQKINSNTGEVFTTTDKEINLSMVSGDAAEPDEDESKAERKEREANEKAKAEEEGFSSFMKFNKIFYTSDNGVVVLAERYNFRANNVVTGGPGTGGMSRQTAMGRYYCGEILACKIDAAGNIAWMQVFPKSQREVIEIGLMATADFYENTYFGDGGRPFFAGFGAIQSADKIQILFNDNPKNEGVTQPGQKVKAFEVYNRSGLFMISIDQRTGKSVRSLLEINDQNVGIPTPRLGLVSGSTMYLLGRKEQLFAKIKVAVARLSF